MAKDKTYSESIEGVVFTEKGLNVRKKPSKNANILFVLKPYEKVLVDGENGKYFSVSTSYGVSGYCLKEFISLQKTTEAGDIT